MTNIETEVLLVRHCEAAHNVADHLIGGRSNDALPTQAGIAQAQQVGVRLLANEVNPVAVYASPAVRTVQTARYCLEAMGFSEKSILLDDDLQELDQGEWTGQPREQVYTPEVVEQILLQGADFKAPGGESRREVAYRMRRSLGRMDQPGLHLVFGHGFAIRSLVGDMLGWDQQAVYESQTDNVSITNIYRQDGMWRVGYVGFDLLASETLPPVTP